METYFVLMLYVHIPCHTYGSVYTVPANANLQHFRNRMQCDI